MDGKAVCWLPAAFGGSHGHKKGVFRVASCPAGQMPGKIQTKTPSEVSQTGF